MFSAVLATLFLLAPSLRLLAPPDRGALERQLDQRLAELDEALGVADLDQAAWKRVCWATEASVEYSNRTEDSKQLEDAWVRIYDGEEVLDSWRVITAGPELPEALRRLTVGSVPEDVEVQASPAGLHVLLELLPGMAGLALEDGDAEGFATTVEAGLHLAKTMAERPEAISWVQAVVLIERLLASGALDWRAEVRPDASQEEREDIQVIATAQRAAQALDDRGQGRIQAALHGALTAIPTLEQVVLIEERFMLLQARRWMGPAPGDLWEARRQFEASRAVHAEMASASRIQDMDALEVRCGLLQSRIQAASDSWFDHLRGDPWTYADFLSPRSLVGLSRMQRGLKRQANLFLQRLERGR